ncbi:hypothetical protein [Sandarakinorhabdus sp.]|uniref:hypothetical protein n=1 Tax=Sandarakinorhabdus sp. TaxID=1916663 RepID=UPI00286DC4AC|nr:hypothetical protein [Sandarakinorhabdus sp.]
MTAPFPPETDLDTLLGQWAAAPVAGAPVDVAAILVLPQERETPLRAVAAWRPALMAASLALVVAVGGWLGLADRFVPTTPIEVAASPSAEAGAGEADAAFALVFTPTAAEEDLI